MKTHSQLGLTETELLSLIKVRDLLAAGLIEHDPTVENYNINRPTQPRFDMGNISDNRGCGTTMCIGGWTKLIDLGITADEQGVLPIDVESDVLITDFVSESTGGLRLLFYPNSIENWNRITPPRAAKAIDNFLNTGFPKWREVLRDHS